MCAEVGTSVLQGCPLAPLSLVILLADPARAIQEKLGPQIQHSLFLDDRAAMSNSAPVRLSFIEEERVCSPGPV